MILCMFPNVLVYLSKCSCVFVQMFLCMLSIFLAVGIAAGAFFSGKKAVPGFWGHATLEKTQFFSCFVYLGPFGSPLESLWLPLGWPWLPSGWHWAPVGVPFGSLWLPLGRLVRILGRPWAPLGSLVTLSWKCLKIYPPGDPKVNFSIDVCSGIGGLEFARRSRRSRRSGGTKCC